MHHFWIREKSRSIVFVRSIGPRGYVVLGKKYCLNPAFVIFGENALRKSKLSSLPCNIPSTHFITHCCHCSLSPVPTTPRWYHCVTLSLSLTGSIISFCAIGTVCHNRSAHLSSSWNLIIVCGKLSPLFTWTRISQPPQSSTLLPEQHDSIANLIAGKHCIAGSLGLNHCFIHDDMSSQKSGIQ